MERRCPTETTSNLPHTPITRGEGIRGEGRDVSGVLEVVLFKKNSDVIHLIFHPYSSKHSKHTVHASAAQSSS